MHLCVFEDPQSGHLLPLTYFRPAFDLRCGIVSLRERIIAFLRPKTYSLLVRDYLAPLVREHYPGLGVNSPESRPTLFVNGRCLMTRDLAKLLSRIREDHVFLAGDTIAAVNLTTGAPFTEIMRALTAGDKDMLPSSLPRTSVDARFVENTWDLVYANESAITADFQLLTQEGKKLGHTTGMHKSAVLLGKKLIHVGKFCDIGPGVVLDARGGPIYIGDDVRILPHAVVLGPASIGNSSIVRIGTRLYEHTTVGPVCKVGGEIEHSIMHSYANKQHDGYLGHSYLSPWVNLGAGTTTSNLKNTYGTIKVRNAGGTSTDTGRMFLGLTAGDHVKTGINATIDTGTIIGPSTNIYGTNLPPRYIPAFSWGEAPALQSYEMERALAVAVKVMARRNVQATQTYKALFRAVHAMTEKDRGSQTS
jgi:UDP-N-acetylglucosamine diphosphorylase/glucosamine-1-phosphate N-acetyltransferase